MLSFADIKPLHLADVTLPRGTPLEGQVWPVYGFVVTHPGGIVVIDTGVGSDQPGIEALYRPVRWPLADGLPELGIAPADVALVINTHLHFDHCGDNQLFPGRPIFAQRAEYDAAQEPRYTIPAWVDFAGATIELLDGEREVLPGLTIVPTPGHTPGHQSVLLETEDGRVIIAGQAAYTASEYASLMEAHPRGLDAAWDREKYLESLQRLRELTPQRVYFSHDATIWDAGEKTGSAG